jgi:hypothetical protein
MTECPNCMTASRREWHGGFTASCMVCEARRIARGPVCFEAQRAGYITPAYRDQLRAVGGDVHWLAVHDLVLAWKRGGEVPTWQPQAAAPAARPR